jgi:hypothetical protein
VIARLAQADARVSALAVAQLRQEAALTAGLDLVREGRR